MPRRIVSTGKAKQLDVSSKHKDGDKLLSPNEIGKILGVTGEAVKQWIYHRRLPATKMVNGYWKVRVSDFERFLEARHDQRFPVFVEASEAVEKAISAAGYQVITAQNLFDAMLKLAERVPMMLVMASARRSAGDPRQRDTALRPGRRHYPTR